MYVLIIVGIFLYSTIKIVNYINKIQKLFAPAPLNLQVVNSVVHQSNYYNKSSTDSDEHGGNEVVHPSMNPSALGTSVIINDGDDLETAANETYHHVPLIDKYGKTVGISQISSKAMNRQKSITSYLITIAVIHVLQIGIVILLVFLVMFGVSGNKII